MYCTKAAYHQIPMYSDSIEISAFICEFCVFEYLSMSMGICSATAWFQRFINNVLRDFLLRDTVGVYLDDIIVFSTSLEVHEEEVRRLLDTLNLRNVMTSFEISHMVTDKLVFLGNTIERGEIKILPTRASGLQNFKIPKN